MSTKKKEKEADRKRTDKKRLKVQRIQKCIRRIMSLNVFMVDRYRTIDPMNITDFHKRIICFHMLHCEI